MSEPKKEHAVEEMYTCMYCLNDSLDECPGRIPVDNTDLSKFAQTFVEERLAETFPPYNGWTDAQREKLKNLLTNALIKEFGEPQ